jgi:cytochrome c oxidase cbb3-type subunit III
MNHRATRLAIGALASLLATASCGTHIGALRRTSEDAHSIAPSEITDFNLLYARNCAGCHGTDGTGGAAIGLADPVYLAIADDATIRRVTANGIPGTAMPAFAQHAGGMLTEDQIGAIILGIRTRWAKPNALGDADAPPYAAQSSGDAARGAVVYQTFCSSCHGPSGHGGTRASSILDGSYLGLVSNQSLRTTVIVGRPEMGAPDWRGNVPGKPMSAEDVSDVVAWLAAQRPQFPGQPYSSALQPTGGAR